jgi:hypothetical protein
MYISLAIYLERSYPDSVGCCSLLRMFASSLLILFASSSLDLQFLMSAMNTASPRRSLLIIYIDCFWKILMTKNLKNFFLQKLLLVFFYRKACSRLPRAIVNPKRSCIILPRNIKDPSQILACKESEDRL